MPNTRYSNQRLNDELLQRGIATFGTYERRLARLQRFLAYENRSKSVANILSRIIFDKIASTRVHTRAFVKQLEAARTLLSLRSAKTETFQSVNIQTIRE